MLYDVERHTKLNDEAWSKSVAEQTIDSIFQNTINQFSKKTHWLAHTDEDGTCATNKTLYLGTAGTLLGLEVIAQKRNLKLPFSPAHLIDSCLNWYREEPDTEENVPSYFLGEVGILLRHFKLNRKKETADQLYQRVEENIENPANEALWGCPGTMMGALFMHQWTGEKRWKELFSRNVDYLFTTWQKNENGHWVWTQDLYGEVRQIVGAGHGFFGNVYPLLQGFELLPKERQQELIDRTLSTTLETCKTEGELTNWPATFASDDQRVRVQWCHGSPGVIIALGSFPSGISNELESVLVRAGELTWHAGPLKKGIALCHGTDGNGYAFLKLHTRTGDSIWLERARKFAMHAIQQRNGRHTLWTGDIGLACYLLSCIDGDCRVPGLDYV